MTQEDKELLLKDLCARLPYGLKVHYKTAGWEDKYCVISPQVIDNMLHRSDVIVKPYLRPMSSMIKEEIKVYNDLLLNTQVSEIYFPDCEDMIPVLDWLDAHHFDYRGLIEKGLAIEVTEDNNPYKD